MSDQNGFDPRQIMTDDDPSVQHIKEVVESLGESLRQAGIQVVGVGRLTVDPPVTATAHENACIGVSVLPDGAGLLLEIEAGHNRIGLGISDPEQLLSLVSDLMDNADKAWPEYMQQMAKDAAEWAKQEAQPLDEPQAPQDPQI